MSSAAGVSRMRGVRSSFDCCTSKRAEFSVRGLKFNVDGRYSLVKPIGQGAYGVLCSAFDATTKRTVALKKLRRVLEMKEEAQKALREVKILRLASHENVLSLHDIIAPESYAKFTELYIVTELMDSDLNQIIRSTQPYSNAHIQYFLYQILRGLKYLHSADILHRDLKPSNILVNANCDCKIADFGMSRALNISDSGRPAYMTGYVTTRWYRAPEVILTWQQYSKALDVWSVGCILAELIGRKPIFPGKSYNDQLSVIFDKVGTPSSGELKFIKCRVTRRKIQTIKPRRPKPLRELYPHAARNALSLLKDLIQFVPGRRLNVKQALEHPYLAELHDPEDEPVSSQKFTFDSNGLKKTEIWEYKRLLWREICHFHQHLDPNAGQCAPESATNKKESAVEADFGSSSSSSGAMLLTS